MYKDKRKLKDEHFSFIQKMTSNDEGRYAHTTWKLILYAILQLVQ